MSVKRRWERITINYEDGTNEMISRYEVERIYQLIPILDGLNEAKELRDKLNRIISGSTIKD